MVASHTTVVVVLPTYTKENNELEVLVSQFSVHFRYCCLMLLLLFCRLMIKEIISQYGEHVLDMKSLHISQVVKFYLFIPRQMVFHSL